MNEAPPPQLNPLHQRLQSQMNAIESYLDDDSDWGHIYHLLAESRDAILERDAELTRLRAENAELRSKVAQLTAALGHSEQERRVARQREAGL